MTGLVSTCTPFGCGRENFAVEIDGRMVVADFCRDAPDALVSATYR
jgi:hypothetical protein